MFVSFNGKILDERRVAISPFDHGFLYGDGVYETMRTYKGNLFQFDVHAKRLFASLKCAKIQVSWSVKDLRGMVERLIAKNGFMEARVRVMVSRGVSVTKGAKFHPSVVSRPTLLIVAYLLPAWNAEVARQPKFGKGIFFEVERNFPEVKTTSIFPLVLARLAADKAQAADALLVNRDGMILEAATSNVFVVRDGVLITARDGVLSGTMRDMILKLAKKKRVRVEFRPCTREEILSADEVFLTNAPRGITILTHIGAKKIGRGKVTHSSVATSLQHAFVDFIEPL